MRLEADKKEEGEKLSLRRGEILPLSQEREEKKMAGNPPPTVAAKRKPGQENPSCGPKFWRRLELFVRNWVWTF